MIQALKTLFTDLMSEEQAPEVETNTRELAAAALMIEVATTDEDFSDVELQTLSDVLRQQFNLSANALQELIRIARTESRDATSLFQFTRCVNDEYSMEEKCELITGMWKVAFADSDLDKYEEHLIRRVADLIHVSHSDFIKARNIARGE